MFVFAHKSTDFHPKSVLYSRQFVLYFENFARKLLPYFCLLVCDALQRKRRTQRCGSDAQGAKSSPFLRHLTGDSALLSCMDYRPAATESQISRKGRSLFFSTNFRFFFYASGKNKSTVLRLETVIKTLGPQNLAVRF